MRKVKKLMVLVLSAILPWAILSCVFMPQVEAPSETVLSDLMQRKRAEREEFSTWAESYSAAEPQLHFPIGHSGSIISMDFSPDGKYLVTGSRNTTLKLWEIDRGRVLRTFRGHQGDVQAVVFSPDGRTIVSCERDGYSSTGMPQRARKRSA